MKWKKIYEDGTVREVDTGRDSLWDIGLDAWLDYRERPKNKKKKKGNSPIWFIVLITILLLPFVILWGIIKAAMHTGGKK